MEQDSENPRADAIAELLWKLGEFVTDHAELVERALGRPLPVEALDRQTAERSDAEQPSETPPSGTPLEVPEHAATNGEPARVAENVPSASLTQLAMTAESASPTIDTKTAAMLLTIGGLPTSAPRGVEPPKVNVEWSRFLERLEECRDVVRAHERGTRARRRMRLGSRDPGMKHALNDRLREIAELKCETWLADESVCHHLSTDDLKRIERRYRALNASLVWTIEFFRDRPKLTHATCKGDERTQLHQRLTTLAEAQCGVRTDFRELADRMPGIHACHAQERTFFWLRDAVREDRFGIHLPFMTLHEHSPMNRAFDILDDIERHRLRQERVDSVEAWKDAIAVDDAPEPPREGEDGFDSVSDAVDAALRQFGGSGSALTFLPRAIESAESSTFRRPDQVFNALKALYEVGSDWRTRADGLGTSFRDRMNQLGFDEKPCSDLTMKHYRKHYFAKYDQREIPLGLHMTLGSRNANTCLSIHWCRDELTRRVVVGHCGRHLPNTLS